MLATRPIDTIQTIPARHLEEAAGVLARTFRDYPVMRYYFGDQGHYYDRAVRAFCRLAADARVATGGEHLGLRRDGRLVGVAAINPPVPAPLPGALQSRWDWFGALVGPGAMGRLGRFAEATGRHRLPTPHFTLAMLGVLPECQGQGYGRALLDATHALAESHPTATGVYLDTETESNVALYERCGYRVIGREQLDDLTIWCMFRPNGGR